ncbi:DUF6966 domain-containing protein [Dactylosporangium darangshiense]|uniref:DUF6966 domain-containing protein n=1 Tax=Dactylosporangium darangshiense TaxID=579108 RepID=A0ABP8DJD1_9ACTN
MTMPTPEALRELLLTMLRLAIGRLRAVGDEHWAEWLQRDHDRIAAGDLSGLAHLRQAFGGMGSINDRYPQDDPEIGTHVAAVYRLASKLTSPRG